MTLIFDEMSEHRELLLGLLNNAALLIMLALLYDALIVRRKARSRWIQHLLSGLVLGGIGIALMLTRWNMDNGVQFDSRSVLLCIAGLFFGVVPTVIAMTMTALMRLHQGGAGAWPGVTVIISSGVIGLIWRRVRHRDLQAIGFAELFGMGLLVHGMMILLLATQLPQPAAEVMMQHIALPVMIIFPVGTALLGRLMQSRLARGCADRRLRESESRYRSLFENNHMPMMILDPETGRIADVNPNACTYYGWPRETMRAMTITEINTLSPLEINQMMHQAREEKRTHFAFHHRRADGSVREVEVNSGPIEIEGRRLLYSIISDVTDRNQTERELRVSEMRFRSLVEAAPIPIFIQASERFAYLNPAALKAMGAESPEQLVGMPVIERFHPDQREQVTARIRHLNTMHEAVPLLEETCLKLDGTAFPAEVSAVPFMHGGQYGALVFFLDLTERKRAEQQRQAIERQIQQTQKLESLGVLAGGIAHDFNNILMAVMGHADLALIELPPMSPARESLREIEKAARRAAELCRQMLAYSGRGNFVIERISLRDLIEEMLHLLKTTITKKAILNLNLEKNLPPMRGDATQIRQLIMNLVINASEAIGERSGVITISTGAMDCTREYLGETYLDEKLEPGLYIWMEVADTGCGMDKETQSRLFEPFFTTKFTGRGLGMAAVMGIVRGHKGALKVYSELNKGTVFKILFPALEEELSRQARIAAAHDEGWRGSGTVLLVDDEETIRALGRKQLTLLGFETLVASDGKEAMAVYREHAARIDLVLLDLTMPHMNGEETFRELRRLNRNVRVVISSGYTESEIVSRFAGKGVAGFVQKPYTLELLRAQLRKALERRDAPDA